MSYGRFIFSYVRTLHTEFHSIPVCKKEVVPFPHTLSSIFFVVVGYFVIFFLIMLGIGEIFKVVLICSYLIARDNEYFKVFLSHYFSSFKTLYLGSRLIF